mmetsp:Transcript_117962/g.338318  ORF Transcript_117962/g.338318 Transcript_117962/m.338318 type:complete len:476 (+) Transcript_117962:133-1560(+)
MGAACGCERRFCEGAPELSVTAAACKWPDGSGCCAEAGGDSNGMAEVVKEVVLDESPSSPAAPGRFNSSELINGEVNFQEAEEIFAKSSLPGDDGGTRSQAQRIVDQFRSPGQTELSEEDVRKIVDELEFIIDWQYDTLLAELVLLVLKEHFLPEECAKVFCNDVVRRLIRKFDYSDKVCQSLCNAGSSWFNIYKDGDFTGIDAFIDPQDSTCLYYKARVKIPTPLTVAMVVANEVDMMPEWNKLVSAPPRLLGRRTAHYMCLNYQMSAAGIFKLDLLNEVRRFTDADNGILVEYVRSVDSSRHPCYRPPMRGFKRGKTELKNVWVACGPHDSVFIQVGKLNLPFSASRWFASAVGSVAGRFLVGGLVKNAQRAQEPGNPWDARLLEDATGVHARMRELMRCEASKARSPVEAGGSPNFREEDLAPLFLRRREARRTFSIAVAHAVDGEDIGSDDVLDMKSYARKAQLPEVQLEG